MKDECRMKNAEYETANCELKTDNFRYQVLKEDFTIGSLRTTSAQMPKGIPNRQQGEMQGIRAIMDAAMANP
jgi:hypothetical protein